MSFPGDEEMLLIWQAPGGGGGGGGTEGDKIENPFVVTGLPFYAEGTTEGFEDDYDAVCPYTGSTSADVVYMMTSAGATYDFTLCTNTAYDSKIYILDIDGNVVEGDFIGIDGDNYGLACNDDACSTPSYAVLMFQVFQVSYQLVYSMSWLMAMVVIMVHILWI